MKDTCEAILIFLVGIIIGIFILASAYRDNGKNDHDKQLCVGCHVEWVEK
jgi:hypothetical protein